MSKKLSLWFAAHLILMLSIGLLLGACARIPGTSVATQIPLPPTPRNVQTATPTSMSVVASTPYPGESGCWIPAAAQPFWGADSEDEDEIRYTLSAEELSVTLTQMGIAAICVPAELGGVYLNVDWNAAQRGDVTGRMISLGFVEHYAGEGWGDAYLVYATYDFAAGTEYDQFAGREDYTALAEGTAEEIEIIEADGVRGLIRYQRGLGYDSAPVYRVMLFPFEAHYIALVQSLGRYDSAVAWDTLVSELRAGELPPNWQAPLPALDALARSLRFTTLPD